MTLAKRSWGIGGSSGTAWYFSSNALSCKEFNLKQVELMFEMSSGLLLGAWRRWAAYTITWEMLHYKVCYIIWRAQTWIELTWTIRLRWQSAANSSPCFSAHISTRASLRFRRTPHNLEQYIEWDSHTILLNSHMLVKWKSCENSWIVRAALTLHRLRSDIAEDMTDKTSAIKKAKQKSK